eukprot:m.1364128 g.1364128  ORF g.1364128 m.1364128 type:complete len:456 (+) comp24946_c0_seq35:334-1701(+)
MPNVNRNANAKLLDPFSSEHVIGDVHSKCDTLQCTRFGTTFFGTVYVPLSDFQTKNGILCPPPYFGSGLQKSRTKQWSSDSPKHQSSLPITVRMGDLRHCALFDVPPQELLHFAMYANLIRLDVSWNSLSRIPLDISRLVQLRELLCRGNNLSAIECSSDSYCYTNLSFLDVRDNVSLRQLPQVLLQRQQLRILRGRTISLRACAWVPDQPPANVAMVVENDKQGTPTDNIGCSHVFIKEASCTAQGTLLCRENMPREPRHLVMRPTPALQHPPLEQQLQPLDDTQLRARLTHTFSVPVVVTTALYSRTMLLGELCRQYALAYPRATHPTGRVETHHEGQRVCPMLLKQLLDELRQTTWPKRQRSQLTAGEYMTLGRPPTDSEHCDNQSLTRKAKRARTVFDRYKQVGSSNDGDSVETIAIHCALRRNRTNNQLQDCSLKRRTQLLSQHCTLFLI